MSEKCEDICFGNTCLTEVKMEEISISTEESLGMKEEVGEEELSPLKVESSLCIKEEEGINGESEKEDWPLHEEVSLPFIKEEEEINAENEEQELKPFYSVVLSQEEDTSVSEADVVDPLAVMKRDAVKESTEEVKSERSTEHSRERGEKMNNRRRYSVMGMERRAGEKSEGKKREVANGDSASARPCSSRPTATANALGKMEERHRRRLEMEKKLHEIRMRSLREFHELRLKHQKTVFKTEMRMAMEKARILKQIDNLRRRAM